MRQRRCGRFLHRHGTDVGFCSSRATGTTALRTGLVAIFLIAATATLRPSHVGHPRHHARHSLTLLTLSSGSGGSRHPCPILSHYNLFVCGIQSNNVGMVGNTRSSVAVIIAYFAVVVVNTNYGRSAADIIAVAVGGRRGIVQGETRSQRNVLPPLGLTCQTQRASQRPRRDRIEESTLGWWGHFLLLLLTLLPTCIGLVPGSISLVPTVRMRMGMRMSQLQQQSLVQTSSIQPPPSRHINFARL
mmetsp:Transcript_7604/g.16665  ORF Transcript_7604/g.16665 Transcript_7604/m.16665 type:complete len:245 (-) Transcript_7604:1338-2072(-)